MHLLRARCYAAYFYAVTFLFGIGGVLARRPPGPLALGFARAWVRALLAGLPIAGIRLKISGMQNLPAEGPVVLASQHQSEFDTLVWMYLLRRPAYVMKQELTKTPLVGPMLVPAGMIPVDRGGGAGALRKLLADAAAAAATGRQIVIFPEGTRVEPGEQTPLQPGVAAVASRLNVPVLPVATDSGLCWPRQRHRLRPGTIHIAIGPPLIAGLPRQDLLAAIEAFWRQAAAYGYDIVDNSVDQPPETIRFEGAGVG